MPRPTPLTPADAQARVERLERLLRGLRPLLRSEPTTSRRVRAIDDEDRARRLAECPHCEDGCRNGERCATCGGTAYLVCATCDEPATAGIVRLAWSTEHRCTRCHAQAQLSPCCGETVEREACAGCGERTAKCLDCGLLECVCSDELDAHPEAA